MPRFAIIIPCHDSAQTILPAVESALAQRHDDFAVVVSDNSSQDATRTLLDAIDDARLQVYYHTERLGKTANWNRAYRHAPDCEFLVTLHSDDILRPGCLACVAEEAARARADIVHGAFVPMSYDGRQLRPRRSFPLAHTASGHSEQEILLLGNIVSVVGATIRRALFECLGGWPARFTYLQDTEFWHRAAEQGRFRYTPAIFGYYRDLSPAAAIKWIPQLEESFVWYLECHRTLSAGRLRAAAALKLCQLMDETKTISDGSPGLTRLRGEVAAALDDANTTATRTRANRQLMLRAMAALRSRFS